MYECIFLSFYHRKYAVVLIFNYEIQTTVLMWVQKIYMVYTILILQLLKLLFLFWLLLLILLIFTITYPSLQRIINFDKKKSPKRKIGSGIQ